MFSLAAINDTDSLGQWEPLAPTKEAQEFHLSQTYHDGLLKLQAKEYEKAQELLEAVLKNPLISRSQVVSSASDGHLLQLKFLALKNLATVFLEQGSSHYERAVHCYLQAVDIDTKDSVVWNHLGTLACSMGSLSISRWAFEQGLVCSPNNWNCMEKLLEVLIAIGDEMACLSVAELILRHWPSHSRALHVKKTIEDSDPLPFEPRGIDKLEPKHIRLKFIDKRKEMDNHNLDETNASKKPNHNLELHLKEVTWASLADALISILLPLGECDSEPKHIKLIICLPSSSKNVARPVKSKVANFSEDVEKIYNDHYIPEKDSTIITKEIDETISDAQRQERRSARRLERLKDKLEKEELDFSTCKDRAKVVIRYLEPFIVGKAKLEDSNNVDTSVSGSFQIMGNKLDTEYNEVSSFVERNSKNYGAYHMAQLLLEEVACRLPLYKDTFIKFLELEKLTRHLGQNRTSEYYLFLAELYQDISVSSPNASNLSECMEASSYFLCKIIESVVLDYPFPLNNFQSTDEILTNENNNPNFPLESLLSTNKDDFWIRFLWLSGRLSVFEGNKGKANEEFCISLSLLTKKEKLNDSELCVVHLPHCKYIKDLTTDRILHEINLLKADVLMKTTAVEMIEKEMYLECINLLAPLIFSGQDEQISALPLSNKEDVSLQLSVLDTMIKACEKAKPMDIEVFLNCHRRKLQILVMSAGMEECFALCKTFHEKSGLKTLSAPKVLKENSNMLYDRLISEEVKEISKCASQVKNFFDQSGSSNGGDVPVSTITDIQFLLLAVMCNTASVFLDKKSSGVPNSDPVEEKHSHCIVNSAIAFCKFQHLDPTVPFKSQVELIVAVHDLLAEFELCCASNGGEGEEGAFLKLAIKHLLALDTKVKSKFNSSNKELILHEERPCPNHQDNPFPNEINVADLEASNTMEKGVCEDISSEGILVAKEKHGSNVLDDEKCNVGETTVESLIGLTEVEGEELEEGIDNSLDQCFFCLYGLNLRSDSCYEDELSTHKNTSRGDYQTKEQCADVFQYVLTYAKDSSKTGLIKLRRVLRAIRKHFPQPPEDVLSGNSIDKFLDDPNLCEEKISEEAGSDGFFDFMMKIIFPDTGSLNKFKSPSIGRSSEPYLEVYSNLYYLLAQSEEISATDKYSGFVLTKEGENFVQQNASLFKYDLLYNPLRFEGWQRLANIYDEEVDLLLNDGSKHMNVSGWRKNDTLPERVVTSRRRSRRCFFMSLALAKTSVQQGEIHELLALVYYDGLQNVVPIYDQRFVVPSKDAVWKMFCQNSLKHFEKAFAQKQDWSHAFYMGKLSEKLGDSHELTLSYYYKAITLNPSAVDPLYRMHASRLKLISTCGKQNLDVLKVVTEYSFRETTKETALTIFKTMDAESSNLIIDLNESAMQVSPAEEKLEDNDKLAKVWHILYDDCLAALETCVEGDLKHFHKARYSLAQGIYRRGESGDLSKAKEELSFCFKSSRSSFSINMWEIDGMVKKGRRKTPAVSANKKCLEVNLPESSRKFITCIRKYTLFYIKLLEETGDISTLERAYISLRTDKRFSLCLEDLIPVAVGRYVKALISSMQQTEITCSGAVSSSQNQLEKIFTLFMEQVTLWPEICSLSEINSPEWSESKIYGYLYQYIQSLEINNKLETLEAINEKIRKRFKNSKVSNTNCAKVCRHASIAWFRSLIISLASITPLHSTHSSEIQELNSSETVSENSHLLTIDIQTNELWSSSLEDSTQMKNLETKWNPVLSEIKNVVVKKASEENLDKVNTLLRCSYNFYRDSSCVAHPSGLNLHLVPYKLAKETQFSNGMQGVEVLDLSTPRKLLLWAYTLVHGRYTNISVVIKHCEENAKSRMKKGIGSLSTPAILSTNALTLANTGVGGEIEAGPIVVVALASVQAGGMRSRVPNAVPNLNESQKTSFPAPQLQQCANNSDPEKSKLVHEKGGSDKVSS